LDRDGDGKISKDEAPEQLRERFGMLDTNGDGFLSLDEFRAGAASFGERLRERDRPVRQDQPEERPARKRE
jgi:Ca2+-binding EF-hand superfamily protein